MLTTKINPRGALLLFICLLLTQTLAAQQLPASVRYASGRKVMKDLSTILSPEGVQESFAAPIGGLKQWVTVRGQDSSNPILLFVHGGPASPLAPVSWIFQRPLEDYFTVVQYDQRASGKTYRLNDTTGLGATIKVQNYVNDAVELATYICKKYNKKKVILAGHSWGTIVAMNAALQRPDLFYAYVGIGQAINVMENERLSFEFGVKEATRLKNDTALQEMATIAPYPGNQPVTRERIIIARKWPQYYGGLAAYRAEPNYFYSAPYLSPEYAPEDVPAIDSGSLFTLDRVMAEFLATDFNHVKSFPIPVFMFMGRHDYTTPSEPANRWIHTVKAPYKKGIWFEHSSHLIPLEEPGKFLISLVEYVRPLANK
ncbi:alpha/beta fold hydrolase [Chitinophaga sp. sic0106]|uniref:alpha/beta fold hydrolase n=1 Tax=Chitinophaga sp. sic0106 TaxID=2854785 RepID=UPI001C48BAC9|nr:alpha/beta hydrolase [Chitinophaga sp. sic0106]MBV7530151.1 alpha/beta hydrolase [Chitinophaga sp. sic0106]